MGSFAVASPDSSLDIALLCVGDELLDGRTADRNAHALGRITAESGWRLRETRFIEDDPCLIEEALRDLAARSPLVVVSGGLGPTLDDQTRGAVATLLGVGLVADPGVRARLEARYVTRGATMSATNYRQADFPEGARIHPSRFGTADAFEVRTHGARILCLPGVPREFAGLAEELLPQLAPTGEPDIRRFATFFGCGESRIAEVVEAIDIAAEVVVTYTATLPYVTLGLRAPIGRATDVISALRAASAALAPWLVGDDVPDLPSAVGRALAGRGLSVATAESCTGGMIASQITDVAGASSYFTHGWVTYSNAAKTSELGVDPLVIERHGAVSASVAKGMAAGARRRSGADAAVAVTGIAGPGGGSDEKPVGLVFLAVATAAGGVVVKARFAGRERNEFKLCTAALAQMVLLRVLSGRADQLDVIRGVEWTRTFREITE